MISGLFSRAQAALSNRAECRHKQAYLSWKKAVIVARLRMRDEDGLFLRPYRCRQCSRWHLTSNQGFRTRQRRRP